jgi:hypothetical protein
MTTGPRTKSVHVISYARQDGKQFAVWLYRELQKNDSLIQPWMDEFDVVHGRRYDLQLMAAIEQCDGLLFVWSPGSVESDDCYRELQRAHRLNKPIIPLFIFPDTPDYYLVEGLPLIDFTVGWESGFAKLRRALKRLEASQARPPLPAPERARLRLEEQPAADESAKAGRARVADGVRKNIQYLNPLPTDGLGDAAFLNRKAEFDMLKASLGNLGINLIIVSGPPGIGKTALVCRVLRSLDSDPQPSLADRVIYLSALSTQPVTASILRSALRGPRSVTLPG